MICFFKQKTADEMRISDWSSDVCSSDLTAGCGERAGDADADAAAPAGLRLNLSNKTGYGADGGGVDAARRGKAPAGEGRPVRASTAEPRVGTACARTCRSRWPPVPEKKNSPNLPPHHPCT